MTSPPPGAADVPDRTHARQAVLGVAVLEGLDLLPTDEAVVLPGPTETVVPWDQITECVAHAATAEDGRRSVSALLRLHLLVTDLGDHAAEVLAPSLRLLALPPDHVTHPGPGWARERLMGGSLDIGIGIVDVVGGRSDCVAVPAGVAQRIGADGMWDAVRLHAEEMAQICAARLRRDSGGPRTVAAMGGYLPQGVIRPVGGVDVPSLLSTSTLRHEIVTTDRSGMRAVGAPMRTRGWYDLTLTDPAFLGAAWMATDPVQRGLNGPVLVTAHEVAVRHHHIDLTLLEERTGSAARPGSGQAGSDRPGSARTDATQNGHPSINRRPRWRRP